MHPLLTQPFDSRLILQKKKRIRRELKENPPFFPVRIAILGGTTTAAVRDVLELFLLDMGIEPTFYESEYGKWYEDAVFSNAELDGFAPQLVLLHTSLYNVTAFPAASDAAADTERLARSEAERFAQAWRAVRERHGAAVIQDNFCLPDERMCGSLSFAHPAGAVRFANRLNELLVGFAADEDAVYFHDVCYLSARIGLDEWYDPNAYCLYKTAFSMRAVPRYCHSLARMIGAIYGRSKKCLVLDLDNTLWGGVVGDDGAAGLRLGYETAEGEAYLAFQRYICRLRERGVILAICSKNDDAVAREGFSHPDCLLKPEDFAAFTANWEPKHENLLRIAEELNIGTDSMAFLDDNPAERLLVRERLPEVSVPEVTGGDPNSYIRMLENEQYFEPAALSGDDFGRAEEYRSNRERQALKKDFKSYEDYLRALEMTAEIGPFSPLYLSRIAQLSNKTNQFNLTTARYTEAEIERIMADSAYLTLCCRLRDRFGDNGVVSLLLGEQRADELHIRLWLMSCRVLKRRVEDAMFSELVRRARERGVRTLYGYYYRTPKNGMTAELFRAYGFTAQDNAGEVWRAETDAVRLPENLPMKILITDL